MHSQSKILCRDCGTLESEQGSTLCAPCNSADRAFAALHVKDHPSGWREPHVIEGHKDVAPQFRD